MYTFNLTELVFVAFLITTFFISYLGRKHAHAAGNDDLSGRNFNKWLVGLSAGATANSGFIVTGAVGLGYTYGAQWLMLPLAWFIGDLIFWKFFPHKINKFGRRSQCTTISELLTHNIQGHWKTAISILSSVVIIIGLVGYTSAQWLAGQKFLIGAFGLDVQVSLIIFAILIITYSSIGGYRGSVYADTFQALLRLLGTAIILGASIYVILKKPESFNENISIVPPSFFIPFDGWALTGIIGFMLGWASASLGFGLGQPQILARYLSASSPMVAYSARWIYMGYVQITWVSMSIFGMLLKGIAPELPDPEQGLSVFVSNYLPPIIAGIIIADIFGVIASTANSILISASLSIKNDLLHLKSTGNSKSFGGIIIIVGILTMVISLIAPGNVVDLALSSVSLVGAGVATPVMIKILDLRHSSVSLFTSILLGLVTAVAWKQLGYSQYINEAAIGITVGFVSNYLTLFLTDFKTQARQSTD